MQEKFTKSIALFIFLFGLYVGKGWAQPVHNQNANTNFATIQAAINAASPGDVLIVSAGTFSENVVVNKPVTIQGNGQGSTFVIPAFSGPNTGPGSLPAGHSSVFLVQASNVTITSLTINGNNPGLTSGVVVNGSDIDARNGIITDWSAGGDWTNLRVSNVTVMNVYYRGIYSSYGTNPGTTYNFSNNTVTNVAGDTGPASASVAIDGLGGSGIIANNVISQAFTSIATEYSLGTSISGNTVTVTATGVGIVSNQNGTVGGTPDAITNNITSGGSVGIQLVVPYLNVTINNNSISGYADAGIDLMVAILAASLQLLIMRSMETVQVQQESI